MNRMFVVPLTLAEANDLVRRWHRHHEPMQGHRLSLGVIDADGELHGAAVVGHAVARMAGDPRIVAEVTRLVSDGTPNVCSMLYAASARACKAMGFERIQTYILETEPGTSLKASGWQYDGPANVGARAWAASNRHVAKRWDAAANPSTPKGRWSLRLNDPRPEMRLLKSEDAPGLWDGTAA